MKVLKAHHCELCQLREYDVQVGTHCSLTHQPPEFGLKCSNIDFQEFILQRYEALNQNQVIFKNRSIRIYTLGILKIFIGLALLLIGFTIFLLINNIILLLLLDMPLAATGVGLIYKSYDEMVVFRQKQNVAVAKFSRLHHLLALYQYRPNQ